MKMFTVTNEILFWHVKITLSHQMISLILMPCIKKWQRDIRKSVGGKFAIRVYLAKQRSTKLIQNSSLKHFRENHQQIRQQIRFHKLPTQSVTLIQNLVNPNLVIRFSVAFTDEHGRSCGMKLGRRGRKNFEPIFTPMK